MRSVRRIPTILLVGLVAIGLTGCGMAGTSPTPTPQRRAANAAPQVVQPKVAASPAASNVAPGGPAANLAPPEPQLKLPSVRVPTDGMQVVMVDSTAGEGVWLRNQPAGEPVRVWPEGSPMLVVGEDKYAEGRNWRNVQTLDGQTGWAAADYLSPTDPSALALAANTLSELAGASGADVNRPAPRTAPSGSELPARPAPAAAQAAPRTAARAATDPGAAQTVRAAGPAPVSAPIPINALPSAAAPVAAAAPAAAVAAAATPVPASTPAPTATPIRAPSGAKSIDVGPTTMAVTGSQNKLPIQIGNRPRTGMELMSVTVKVTNRDGAPFALYRSSFKLALSDRTRVEPLAGGDTPLPYSASVEPGGTVEGSLTFEVPTGTRVDGLIWAPDRDVAYQVGI